jgi:predicted MFS family arabinose efflux permease
MGALVFGILHGAEAGWSDPLAIAAFAAAAVLLVALVLNERRSAQPIMPLRLFSNRVRAGALVTRVLFLGAMTAYFFYLTQFLQGVVGFSPLITGLAFLPMTAVNFVVAMLVPRLTHRFGGSALLIGGIAVTLAGMAWLSRLEPGSPYLLGIALPMVLIGAGQGLAFAPLTSAGIAQVAPADAGAASGLVNAAHQLGGSLGLGILTAIGVAAASGTTEPHAELAARVSAVLTGGSVLLALALAVTALFVAGSTHRKERA